MGRMRFDLQLVYLTCSSVDRAVHGSYLGLAFHACGKLFPVGLQILAMTAPRSIKFHQPQSFTVHLSVECRIREGDHICKSIQRCWVIFLRYSLSAGTLFPLFLRPSYTSRKPSEVQAQHILHLDKNQTRQD